LLPAQQTGLVLVKALKPASASDILHFVGCLLLSFFSPSSRLAQDSHGRRRG